MSIMGDNLVFLISQPRVGSTLLQRILGNHPDIHTVSEPWLMLPPLYPLRNDGLQVEYDLEVARKAVLGFFQNLPEGEDEYFNGLRCMYGGFYAKALRASGKRYFLDKTPRYYFIISELYRTFPQAHFIIMFRNPLAVLCSITNTWVQQHWHSLRTYKYDLIRAPNLLLKGMEALGRQALVVSYERLLHDPKAEVEKVCEWLAIEFVPAMIQYGQADLPRWPLGDQEKVYRHSQPSADSVDKWVIALDDPQIWRLANEYLDFLGKNILDQMGYSYEELQRIVERRRPGRFRLRKTSSLAKLLQSPVEKYQR
jgi:hypothetical protein